MSRNLQRQGGITETKAGLTAKAQTPINLILEMMGVLNVCFECLVMFCDEK